jgi:hypothetical protein
MISFDALGVKNRREGSIQCLFNLCLGQSLQWALAAEAAQLRASRTKA